MISKVHVKPYIYEYIYSNNCQYCFNPAPSLCFVDGYNVNARLGYEGMALAYRKYSKRYVPEEDQARIARRGMLAVRVQVVFAPQRIGWHQTAAVLYGIPNI